MNFSVVGKSVNRVDAWDKVTGSAQYAGDIMLPGMLHMKILRSPVPHAKILNIDTSKAKKLPGVKAVITGHDLPKVKFGNWRLFPQTQDEYALKFDRVRYIGDEIAAVAAIDKDIAEEALELIDVDFEELPAVYDLEEAMKEGAPILHDEVKNNISVTRNIEYGDVDKAFKEADYVREDTFWVHAVQHSYMEPSACVAKLESDGRITIWTSTQTPYIVQCLLAACLGMRENDIRVIKPYVGGGFGGKMELRPWEVCVAYIAKTTGKPVKFVMTREEELLAGRRRHPMKIISKIGFKKDGTIVGKEFTVYLDGGAYNSMGPTATFLCGYFGCMLYKIPNYRFRGYHVYTNKAPAGAMRGFGAPQALFATETQMNIIAEELGIDPIDLRIKNAMEEGDVIPGVARISSCGFKDCLEKVRKESNWDEKRKNLKDGEGIGIGCYSFISGGVFNWFNTSYPFTACEVRVFEDGTAHLFTMASDIGQGSDTVLRQILAEELGINPDDVKIISADTTVTPQADLGTWGSRVTLMAGNAIIQAARKIKEKLFGVLSMKFGLNVIHDMECKNGKVYSKTNPEKYSMDFKEAVRLAQKFNRGEPIFARGYYTPRDKGLVTPAFSFGAQIAEVKVDKETGRVRVERIITAHDCGTPINPKAVDGQLEGAIQMALGYALSENIKLKDGLPLNRTFLDYKLFTALDMPESKSLFADTYEPEGPFGAKEAGEGLAIPTAPAVADAIWHATGYRAHELPITAERLVKFFKEKK